MSTEEFKCLVNSDRFLSLSNQKNMMFENIKSLTYEIKILTDKSNKYKQKKNNWKKLYLEKSLTHTHDCSNFEKQIADLKKNFNVSRSHELCQTDMDLTEVNKMVMVYENVSQFKMMVNKAVLN